MTYSSFRSRALTWMCRNSTLNMFDTKIYGLCLQLKMKENKVLLHPNQTHHPWGTDNDLIWEKKKIIEATFQQPVPNRTPNLNRLANLLWNFHMQVDLLISSYISPVNRTRIVDSVSCLPFLSSNKLTSKIRSRWSLLPEFCVPKFHLFGSGYRYKSRFNLRTRTGIFTCIRFHCVSELARRFENWDEKKELD